jgi:hypothetical protein
MWCGDVMKDLSRERGSGLPLCIQIICTYNESHDLSEPKAKSQHAGDRNERASAGQTACRTRERSAETEAYIGPIAHSGGEAEHPWRHLACQVATRRHSEAKSGAKTQELKQRLDCIHRADQGASL